MFGISLDPANPMTMTRQLCDALRARILRGEIAPEEKLPSTREASREMGIARNVLIEAYEQLTSEGYLEGRGGAGTYVASGFGVRKTAARLRKGPPAPAGGGDSAAEEAHRDPNFVDFDRACGTPDPLAVPTRAWSACLKKAAETAGARVFDYSRGEDDAGLREALRSYLFRAKGIAADSSRIVVTSGIMDGLLFAGLFFSSRFTEAFVEDPTIDSTRNLLSVIGYSLRPMEVDPSGATGGGFLASRSGALVVLTPSHHFPTGTILSAGRRGEFLEAARGSGSFILEDDYDGEFKLKGIPVPPLATLDEERVLYAATFSKTLFPSIRMGFLLVPEDLVGPMRAFKRRCSFWSNLINQRAMAAFIEGGFYERHIRRMKKLYAAKRAVVEEETFRNFGDRARIGGSGAGMHLTVEFPDLPSDRPDWRRAMDFGFSAQPLGRYRLERTFSGNKIVLGYGNLSHDSIREGIGRMARFLAAGPIDTF